MKPQLSLASLKRQLLHQDRWMTKRSTKSFFVVALKQMRPPFIYIILFLVAVIGCGRDIGSSSRNSPQPQSRVVFRGKDGLTLTANDLANATGKFDYEIMSTNEIPERAHVLHQQACQLGAAGKYEQAIELLSEAQSLAPDWPYPTYDMAFTYLLMNEFSKARECYEKTVKLSPRGFFTALTALDALNKESNGDLPEGTYYAYMSLEWIGEPKQKTQIVQALVERSPGFAPGWKEFALLCDEPTEKLDAIEKGLAANPDAETKGTLLINKALTLNQQGENQAARDILGNLALDPDTSFANEHLAKQTLAMIAE